MSKRLFLASLALILGGTVLHCGENTFGEAAFGMPAGGRVPLKFLFHDIGWNALRSVARNYGANFAGAALGTWVFVESGIDWKWNRFAYDNTPLAEAGYGANLVGYVVPALGPLVFYATGLLLKDARAQVTALALGQSLLLTLGFQTALKFVTQRTYPGIMAEFDNPRTYRSSRTDDYSGEFNWFGLHAIDGWPSGHTMAAFSAAATVAQLYDNFWVKFGSYAYAAVIGFGMSVSVHWASDVLAGALIGCAIGTTVGRSFRGLPGREDRRVSLHVAPNAVAVRLRL